MSVLMSFESVRDYKYFARQSAAKHHLFIEYYWVRKSTAPFFGWIIEAMLFGDLPKPQSYCITKNTIGAYRGARVIHIAFALDNLEQCAAVTRWFVALRGGGA